MFQTKIVEKIETHILCSLNYFQKSCSLKVMWKNIVEPDRPQITLQLMRIACWLPEATNTH